MPNPAPAWLNAAIPGPADGLGALAMAGLADERAMGRGLSLKSAAFANGGELDPSFTATEEDAVAPPLEWAGPPPGTQELVLVVQSPDGEGAPVTHWIVWGLPGQKGQLLEGEAPPRVGKNSAGNSEWMLPNPPAGAAPRRYVFQLFALDLPITLMPGATLDELLDSCRGHVMAATALTATFAHDGEDEAWDDEELD
ncbi:YbhB/YbcL family Raf kinase inhibitor-like protein [Alteriqipengyuania flavescens]|uniref:YbhB/YbcL family Raf kinase inhibitor-like protein n=1 Tax=Alteriqipengyuania flavescens TaxID=3053610 RepID=UPI0025B5E93C|nr:YbhB/YbcL family Raf kinase inhibitor-like protein [Alteriqipengyuania flavescens]WJY17725.1 YbhB/YbcL family Raf kinase inhibitor-like protein [Alteriqipengyuania flavescens]WJY23668.1 YbhB/YbcL family Raf kinase inhibitor-like protein [Alteriqipengyuania flavescens]